MNASQRAIYDQSVKFFGAPMGPRLVFLETPEVGIAWSNLLTALQKSSLPRKLWELSILIVAREWGAQFEWWAHEPPALKAGLSPTVIDAVRTGNAPPFQNEEEAAAYAYVTELLQKRRVSQETYDRLRGLIGSRQLVELTALVGHYNSVAMTLIAHEVSLPPGTKPPLPELSRR
jgi:4-carboxymuconolactone decarboxylase